MTSKMNCKEVLSKLYAYLDQEVDAPTEADIEEHLHDCRECFSRAEFEKRLKQKVSEAGSAKTPEDVKKRLQSLIKQF